MLLLCFDGNKKKLCFTFEFKQNGMSSIKEKTNYICLSLNRAFRRVI